MRLATMPSQKKAIHRLAAAALVAALFLLAPASFAQVTPPANQGGTLGIDCEQPRRTPEGKLIPGDDGSHRARCEADRTTALTYVTVVRETRDQLRSALESLPPPLWNDLIDHLRTNDLIGAWRYSDATVIGQLRSLSRDPDRSPDDPTEIATPSRVHAHALHWQAGLLNRTSFRPEWRGTVRARACGVTPGGEIQRGAMILVWLDPSVIRDRWTPQMVQRTARVWLERRSDYFVARDQIPDVRRNARQLTDANGRNRDISGTAAIRACFATVPVNALVMRLSLRRNTESEHIYERCPDPDQVGVQHRMWERHNGVLVVPANAIRAGGIDHTHPVSTDHIHHTDPDTDHVHTGPGTDANHIHNHPRRGEPLLDRFADSGERPPRDPRDPPLLSGDYPVADEANATFLIRGSSCREPRTLDAVRAVECDATINNTPVKGTHVRTFRFREVQNDPNDRLRIDMVPVMRDPNDPGNLLGVIAPAGTPHPVWTETTLFCDATAIPTSDAPVIPPRVPEDWGYPDCEGAHGPLFHGRRQGYVQTITYPPGWPVDDVKVRTIDDDCYRVVEEYGSHTRPGPACPAGHSGKLVEGRDLRWWNRVWAVQDGVYPRMGRTLPDTAGLADAIRVLDANPSQAGLGGLDRVWVRSDWHTERNTCEPPIPKTGTQTRTGSCPAGQTGSVTEERSLNWYNPGHTNPPPQDMVWRSLADAARDYDAGRGGAWYNRVTLKSGWSEISNTCRPQRTCGYSCSARGGTKVCNSEGCDCEGAKLPACRSGGGGGGGGGGPENPGSTDTTGDGFTDTVGSFGGGFGTSPDGVGSKANPGTSFGGGNDND